MKEVALGILIIIAVCGISYLLYIQYKISIYKKEEKIKKDFQDNLQPGDLCKVRFGERIHKGTIVRFNNHGNPQVQVSFKETKDFPYDKENHKILETPYFREQIYPMKYKPLWQKKN